MGKSAFESEDWTWIAFMDRRADKRMNDTNRALFCVDRHCV